MNVPATATTIAIVDGPRRVGTEQRWRIRLPDGSPAVLAQLLPELARDQSIRRRWVRDVERVRALELEGLAPVIELGPSPDPRDPRAAPPFRVRRDPAGESLEAWLSRRAPAPIDEACAMVADLADVVHRIHAHGAVVRDLHPRHVTIADDGRVWLTDVGLARVDVLSTRTAASLVLEGSPYASPEQLARTTIDQRSDLYGLGVILFRALTGALPFGDQPALLRDPDATVVGPASLRPGVPAAIDGAVRRCLEAQPQRRLESAAALAAILRGDATAASGAALARVTCQSCGAALRPGQRLCIACGKLAVQFEHAREGGGFMLVLPKVKEDAAYLASLRKFLESVSDGMVPPLNFIIGDARMYSKEEQQRLIKLPVPVLKDLTEDSARRIQARLQELGIATEVKTERAVARSHRKVWALAIGAAVMVTLGLAFVVGPIFAAIMSLVVLVLAAGLASIANRKRRLKPSKQPLIRLRAAPAALPASDPLVRRLAELLSERTPADVREQVGELALLVQQLVDHRIENAGERAEIDAVTEPVGRLVDLVAKQVEALDRIDAQLATLDEGAIVRSLVAAEARKEPASTREELLDALDKLRGLEDERAHAFHRLLQASALLRRAVQLGLSVHDDAAAHEREIALALAALE